MISALIIFCALSSLMSQTRKQSHLSGPYLGQKPPGTVPEVFAPDILSSDKHPHGHLTFSADGKAIYWSAYQEGSSGQTIFFSLFDGVQLSRPVKAPFAADSGYGGPDISSDGTRLFFSMEQHSAVSSRKPFAIYYVEKKDDGWSKPRLIKSSLDTVMTKGQISVAHNGNIYITGRI